MKKKFLILIVALMCAISSVFCLCACEPDDEDLNYSISSDGASYYVSGVKDKENSSIIIKSTYKGKPVSAIGRYAFGNSKAVSVEIPDSIIDIDDYAFFSCNRLTSVEIPNSVTSIGERAFESCRSLTTVSLGNSVVSIGDCAFTECIGLTNINIPSSVTSIGIEAFSHCRELKSIAIPSSVTKIGRNAFGYCENLITVRFNGTKAQWENVYNELSWKPNEGLEFPIIICSDGELVENRD